MSDLAWLGIAEAAALIRRRALSPVELTEALLARIRRLDGDLNCFIAVTADRALAAARAAEAEIAGGRWRGPLHGIPYALKDIIDVAGLPTTAHSKIFPAIAAARHATVTARLEAAGAVLLGKLAAHEFAVGGPSFDLPWPPARNPWDRERLPGGSSSGSAAGLGAGFFPLTIGTDTGGSIRNPASFCGVTGMKPTYDLVPRAGVFPLAFSLDHVGPMTRGVADNAVALAAIAGGGAGVTEAGIAGLRIGVIRHFYDGDIQGAEEQAGLIEAAIGILREQGAQIRDITLPPLADFNACGQVIMAAESYALHEGWLKTRAGDYGARGRERLLAGALLPASDYLRALRWRRDLCRRTAAAFADIDVAITAASVDPACRFDDAGALGAIYGRQVLMPFNVTGQPALVVPAGLSADGLPVSVPFVGPAFGEAAVYRVAEAYEAALAWKGRPPLG